MCLRGWFVCSLLLLSLTSLRRLLLVTDVSVNVRRGRVGWLWRWHWCPYSILPQWQQELNLLQQIFIAVQLKVTTQLKQTLRLLLCQLTKELEHESFIVDLFDFLSIGGLCLLTLSSIRFIDETLQKHLCLFVWFRARFIGVDSPVYLLDALNQLDIRVELLSGVSRGRCSFRCLDVLLLLLFLGV